MESGGRGTCGSVCRMLKDLNVEGLVPVGQTFWQILLANSPVIVDSQIIQLGIINPPLLCPIGKWKCVRILVI